MAYYTLITGATGGLGNAFAFACAEKGHNLILTGTNTLKLESITKRIVDNYKNIKVVSKTCDLSDEKDRKQFIDYLNQEELSVNFLINNAGYIAEGEFLRHTDEEVIKTIRVNCEGTVDITQKIIKARKDNSLLRIITVSSMAGDYPMPYMGIYSATKSMLTSIMVSLNYELKDGNVIITTICPSGIPTTEEMKDAIKAQGFAGKITASSPEYIANLALKANEKGKVLVVPKMVNKFIKGISRLCSEKSLAKIVGKRWKKAQEKRNLM